MALRLASCQLARPLCVSRQTATYVRHYSTATPEEVTGTNEEKANEPLTPVPVFVNRNPRNAELMKAIPPPHGCFFKATIEFTDQHTYARVAVPEGRSPKVTASTRETQIRSQLYGTNNVSAAYNLGLILAQRCLDMGINSVHFDREGQLYHGKVKAFAQALQKGGLTMEGRVTVGQTEGSPRDKKKTTA
eukprot:comp26014_c0_seq1/m.47071 comp26014_c0_seq1/g.47071  ORF comp26014_c0_seq1/g.47071 comp26014_c0_seq1/m.47071 type:complete len:190 (-) comp26014_c0_seq1:458-1027(-)